MQSGDSLWSIAKKFGITVNELKEANNLSSNALSIGQLLKIPSQEQPQDKNTYIVKSGDTLYSIAREFNVTVSELKNFNNLTSNTLKVGQILKIPTNQTNTYIVQSGDSLYSIARKYNTTVDQLKSLNNLTSTLLSIGQILNVPETQEIPGTEYIVQKGDNLYSIAKKFNLTQQELMDYNNLTSNLLSIGQVLKIPTNQTNTYIVQSGDSLYSIARRYNITVQDLKEKNNLSSDSLSIGQVLII